MDEKPTQERVLPEYTVTKIKQWSERMGMEPELMVEEFWKIYDERKALFPNQADNLLAIRATDILGAEFSSELRSRAEVFQAMFFGSNEKSDLSAVSYEQQKAQYDQACRIADPTERTIAVAELVQQGLIDRDGTPLDTREFFSTGRKNPNYAKPIAPFFQKNAVGVGRKKDDQALKFLILRLGGKQVDLDVPVGYPVQFRANESARDETRVILNSSVTTKFKQVMMPDLSTTDMLEVLNGVPEVLRATPLTLEKWHDDNKGKPMRVVFLFGDVVAQAEESRNGNWRLALGAVSENIEHRGTTIFMPPKYGELLQKAGIGSQLCVIGMTTLGTDMQTSERTQVNLNGWVVVPIDLVEPRESIFVEEPDVEVK